MKKEKPNTQLIKLKKDYENLKFLASQKRRKGYYVSPLITAQLMVTQSDFEIVKTFKNKKDLIKLKEKIKNLKKDLNSAEKDEIIG